MSLSDAERQRLCEALWPVRYDKSVQPSLGEQEEIIRDESDWPTEILPGGEIVASAPPIDSDPAWAVKAMEATCRRLDFYLSVEPCKGSGDGVLWEAWPHEGGVVSTEDTFPEAVGAALLRALDAGAFPSAYRANIKTRTSHSTFPAEQEPTTTGDSARTNATRSRKE